MWTCCIYYISVIIATHSTSVQVQNIRIVPIHKPKKNYLKTVLFSR